MAARPGPIIVDLDAIEAGQAAAQREISVAEVFEGVGDEIKDHHSWSRPTTTTGEASDTPAEGSVEQVAPARAVQMTFRTYFDVEHLSADISALGGEEAVFMAEVFVRLVYATTAENDALVQHFQFMDIMRDGPPYPNGRRQALEAISGREPATYWFRTDSVTRLVRCMCTVERDPRTTLGYILVVCDIRDTSWREISAVWESYGAPPLASTIDRRRVALVNYVSRHGALSGYGLDQLSP